MAEHQVSSVSLTIDGLTVIVVALRRVGLLLF